MSHELCPLCGRTGKQPLPATAQTEESLIFLIQSNEPGWQPEQGICQPCFDLFRGAHDRLKANPKIFHNHRYRILPTPLRVGADERFTGRGITIAFLDSGFFPHPDLIEPRNRILRYVNITAPDQTDQQASAE
ncbi:MAG TPA: hypothetical protein VGB07_35465, partial [Blastocatellia bacterium]